MIKGREITGRMVLGGMIAFFAVIFAVNGVFMYFALDSWPGLTVTDSYQKGVDYNRTLSAAEAQNAMGWRSGVQIKRQGDGLYSVDVSMRSKADRPIQGLSVVVEFRRPTHEGYDRVAELQESAPGHYTAATALPLAGKWHAVVRAGSPNGTNYRMIHELPVIE